MLMKINLQGKEGTFGSEKPLTISKMIESFN
jgi:hypothetical protein